MPVTLSRKDYKETFQVQLFPVQTFQNQLIERHQLNLKQTNKQTSKKKNKNKKITWFVGTLFNTSECINASSWMRSMFVVIMKLKQRF